MSEEPEGLQETPVEPEEGTAVRLLRSIPAVAGLPGPLVALVGLGIAAFASMILLDAAGILFRVLSRGLGDLLTVLLVGMVTAYLLDPIIDRFEARGWKRTWAILVSLTLFILFLALAVLLLVPYVVRELADLSANLDTWAKSFGQQMGAAEVWLHDRTGWGIPLGWSDMADELPQLLEKFPSGALDPLGVVAQWAVGWFGGLVGFLIVWALYPIFTFFFLRDFDRMKAGVFELAPFRWRRGLLDHYLAIDKKIAQFLRGQFLLCCILAVLYATGLGVFTDIPLGVLIGVVAGLLFIIPYFGTFIGIIAGTLMAFVEFGISWEIVKVWAVFGSVQAVEGALLTPKIVGDSVGLHPVFVMLALVVGANLFGFLGILLAVPVVAGCQVILGTLVSHYRATDWFQRGRDGAPTPEDLP